MPNVLKITLIYKKNHLLGTSSETSSMMASLLGRFSSSLFKPIFTNQSSITNNNNKFVFYSIEKIVI